jgi:hypothetical protein
MVLVARVWGGVEWEGVVCVYIQYRREWDPPALPAEATGVVERAVAMAVATVVAGTAVVATAVATAAEVRAAVEKAVARAEEEPYYYLLPSLAYKINCQLWTSPHERTSSPIFGTDASRTADRACSAYQSHLWDRCFAHCRSSVLGVDPPLVGER